MTTAGTRSVLTGVLIGGSLPKRAKVIQKVPLPTVERMLVSWLCMAAVAVQIVPKEIQVWTVWSMKCVGFVIHWIAIIQHTEAVTQGK